MRAEIAIAALRRRDETAQDLMHAWHVATFGVMAYAGKLPSLKSVLARLSGPTVSQLTPATLEAAMNMVGIKGRPVSEAAMKAFRRTQES